VVTRPDKPAGRHHSTPRPSPIKHAAIAEDLPVLQPSDPSTAEFIRQASGLKPDVSAVVAYGHILKPGLLEVPRLGSVNVHASLLPRLRGAAPIERAILEGLTETGVTIMQMDAGMDTGPILHQVPTPIPADETAGELRVRLAEIGALALVEALTLMEEAELAPRPQDESLATYAPKITREEERLAWSGPADAIARKIRAFDPAPGAWTECHGKPLKLFGARATLARGTPGRVLAAGEVLCVAANDGAVEVCEVQPAGRQRMSVQAFVSGRGVAPGDVLT
jgi:methionyl-tRNA formyltransferase